MTRTTLHSTAPELGVIGWLNRCILWLIGLAVLCLVVAKFLPLIQKNMRMRRDLQVVEEQVRRLQWERYRNAHRIHALQTDPRTVEREIRERHGFSRPGELVITFRELDSSEGGKSPNSKVR